MLSYYSAQLWVVKKWFLAQLIIPGITFEIRIDVKIAYVYGIVK